MRLMPGGSDRQSATSRQNTSAADQAAADAAAKKAKEEAARREAEAKAATEKAARDAEQARQFLKAKSEALSQMKGLDFDNSGNDTGLKGLDDHTPRKGNAVTVNEPGLKDALNDHGWGLKGVDSPPAQFIVTDAMVVDARNVPTGLPKSVADAIPNTPAGNRVRKGFQAVLEHDWKVALAWFQDALNHEPGDPGLKRLVDLAQFTLDYRSRPHAPVPDNNTSQLRPAPVPANVDRYLDERMDEELSRALDDFGTYIYRRGILEGVQPAARPPAPPAPAAPWSWEKFFDSLKPERPPSVPASVRG